MPKLPNYAIVLTHNRPELLARCVQAIAPQVDGVIVVDNASDPPAVPPLVGNTPNAIIVDLTQPPNLSKLWNRAFIFARRLAAQASEPKFNLLMLCDDAIAPPGWVDCVTTALREHGGPIAAATLPNLSAPLLKTEPDSDIMHRMPGHAYALRGEAGLQADESLHWWWCDTDIDWQARKKGGTLLLPGPVVPNERPNEFTVARSDLTEQAVQDGLAFKEIWGWRPW